VIGFGRGVADAAAPAASVLQGRRLHSCGRSGHLRIGIEIVTNCGSLHDNIRRGDGLFVRLPETAIPFDGPPASHRLQQRKAMTGTIPPARAKPAPTSSPLWQGRGIGKPMDLFENSNNNHGI
jgi:hypothetical protein